jgi:hypothetical protein
MSVLLFGAGAFAVVVGAVLIAFGIPINEFSFGNTLILAGTIAFVGGLIVLSLGVVVSQLQRLAEALATRAPIKSSRGLDMFEPAAGTRPAPARVAFPPKPKAEAFEPHPPANLMPEEPPAASYAPTLRNPDEAPVTVEDEVSLSPRHPITTPAPAAEDLDEPASGWRPAAQVAAPPRQTAYFDAMWPAESQSAKSPAAEAVAAVTTEAPARAVAILKSGVVDGMGYTLYVDGSIEAELPQGTLRFASINELRSHLEKNA